MRSCATQADGEIMGKLATLRVSAIIATTALTAALTVATAGAATAAEEGGVIAGTVTGGYIEWGEGQAEAFRLVDGAWQDEASVDIAADGSYTLDDLPAGTYRVSFTDIAGYAWDDEGNRYANWREWWADETARATATDIVVTEGAVLSGIDADLDTVGGVLSWPTITGTATAGQKLTASPGVWPAGVRPEYEWYADGEYIAGAASSTLTLTAAMVGKRIAVFVWGEKEPGQWEAKDSAPTRPVQAMPVVAATTPKITGTAAVGSTVSATAGTWTTGATLGYQWYANGVAIAKATTAKYTIPAAQLGKKLTVKVTGTKGGHTTTSRTSTPTAAVKAGTLSAPTPSVSGTVAYGATLTAKPGSWTAGTTLTYQWYASGKAISKATAVTLKLGTAHKGKTISVKVTGKKSGYTTVAKTSKSTGKVATAGTPTVSGSAVVGSKLTAKPGTWTSGTSLTYQWYSDGKAISKATKSTFTIGSAQRGTQLTVKVTGKKSGYATVTKASKASLRVPTVTTPKISGSATATKALKVTNGTWTSGTTFTYQWYANGKAIKGATKSTLTLSTGFVGKKLTVKVTGKKSGYTTVARTSAATKAVAYPSTTAPASKTTCPSWAPIKGNASSGIYHGPGQRFYKATHPEDCFRTEGAAVSAGYRKAKV